jgi:hypothetical protein
MFEREGSRFITGISCPEPGLGIVTIASNEGVWIGMGHFLLLRRLANMGVGAENACGTACGGHTLTKFSFTIYSSFYDFI